MGLDITAYSNIKNLHVEHVCEETIDKAYEEGNMMLWPNPAFPEQAMGIEEGVYSYGRDFGFRAGSYGWYNDFRETLARSAGYEPKDVWNAENPDITLPFYWMVNFSDCEGIINAAHSARLLREFEEHRERFVEFVEGIDSEWMVSKYDNWTEAFRLASDNGVVDFH